MAAEVLALRKQPASLFAPNVPEDNNVRVIVSGLSGRQIKHETEVWVENQGASGRIDIVAEFGNKLYGWEVKQYDLSGPTLVADGIAQAADYAKAEIASGTWQGRFLDFVFVGPLPNAQVAAYRYVPAEMLSRYTGPLGVGVFDQRMGTYAFGAEAIRFMREPLGWKFCFNFDRVKKHKSDFRR